jgi:hypothetical protein
MPETQRIPSECRPRAAGSALSFFCVWRIDWDLQGFCRNVQNDAATIDPGFRPKIPLGLGMRPSAIISMSGHVAK